MHGHRVGPTKPTCGTSRIVMNRHYHGNEFYESSLQILSIKFEIVLEQLSILKLAEIPLILFKTI